MIAPWWYLLLWSPKRIEARLERLHANGVIAVKPNLWQAWLGVVYMWVRVAKRPETIGLSDGAPVRQTPGAKRMDQRLYRIPAVLRARAVNPGDQTGLGSSATHVIRHLLAAYHPGENLLYDLAILHTEPGALAELRARAAAVVDGSDPNAEALRDLTVYEGYHEKLLASVVRWMDEGRTDHHQVHPDTTLPAFLAWCAAQPATPADTLRAIAAGRQSFVP
jgi:hypothetical protein